MKKAFLMGTVDNRIPGLLTWVKSAKGYIAKDWHLILVAQHYTPEQEAYVTSQIKDILGSDVAESHVTSFFMPDYMGCYRSKMHGMREVDADYYISVDDDMRIIANTHYNRMLDIYKAHKEIGLLTGNMVKTPAIKNGLVPKLKNKLVYDPFAWTCGGLLFGRDLRDLFIQEQDRTNKDYLNDDVEWGLEAYTNGFIQALYYGSVIIHDTESAGGFADWAKLGKRDLCDETLIEYYRSYGKHERVGAENAVRGRTGRLITSTDLTPKAHRLHTKNKRIRVMS